MSGGRGDRNQDEGPGAGRGAELLPWQAALQRHLAALDADEVERLHVEALRSLDRATRARSLTIEEIARLSALADYLAPRVGRRQSGGEESAFPPVSVEDAVLFGLMAGYQLAAGESAPQEPDPFAD
jgi:hypothetical protein